MLDRFLTYIRAERRYSEATSTAYGRDIRRFFNDLGIDEQAFDPHLTTPDDIRKWIVKLTGEGLSPASVNRMTSSLRSFFRWLRKTGAVEKDPFLRIGQQRMPSKLPSYVPEPQMRSLIEQPVADTFENERNALIIILFYATGMRLAELVGIRRSDFSDGFANLRIIGKGNKERVVPLIEYARARVQAHIERIKAENICIAEDNFLFLTVGGGVLSRTAIYRIVRGELERAGVQGKRSPHVLRHTFATHMLADGADMREIQEVLGHTSLAATQVYTHNSIARLKEVYRGAHPRGGRATGGGDKVGTAPATDNKDE